MKGGCEKKISPDVCRVAPGCRDTPKRDANRVSPTNRDVYKLVAGHDYCWLTWNSNHFAELLYNLYT